MPRSSASKLLKYDGPRANLIVVEGADDFYALGYLCDIHGVMKFMRLEEAGGVEALRKSIDTYLLESELKCIGFVVDADDTITSRWASLRTVLTSDLCGNRSIPDAPVAGGFVAEDNKSPRLGLWVMPNNRDSGTLDEFLRSLVPENDPHWDYVVDCVNGIPDPPSQHPNWISKARLHTWLAWRKESPGKPIGQAMGARDFDPHKPEAQEFIAWLRRLFELEPVP